MPLRGERLRELRLQAQLTQEELAERLAVHQGQIYRYESGNTDPDGDIVGRMAKVLLVTTDYLLGLTDSPTQEISEGDLSPDERELIRAYRQKRAGKLLEAAASIVKENEEARIPAPKPATNR